MALKPKRNSGRACSRLIRQSRPILSLTGSTRLTGLLSQNPVNPFNPVKKSSEFLRLRRNSALSPNMVWTSGLSLTEQRRISRRRAEGRAR